VVIHAAAQRHRHGVDPSEYTRTNLALTRAALEVAARSSSRLVLISSISVYGWPRILPIDESFPYAPRNAYGESKVECERLVRASGQPYCIVQPSITYGPGDTNGMVEKILRMVARRRFVVAGWGSSRVQLVYIDDLVASILEASASPRALGQAFICTAREPIRMRDLVRCAARAVGAWLPPIPIPKAVLGGAARAFELAEWAGFVAGEPMLTREKLEMVSADRCYRIDRMVSLLGIQPAVGYEEGLRRTARALGLG
jgi:nucleoside-diphosphate-sugar epimerase